MREREREERERQRDRETETETEEGWRGMDTYVLNCKRQKEPFKNFSQQYRYLMRTIYIYMSRVPDQNGVSQT